MLFLYSSPFDRLCHSVFLAVNPKDPPYIVDSDIGKLGHPGHRDTFLQQIDDLLPLLICDFDILAFQLLLLAQTTTILLSLMRAPRVIHLLFLQ